MNELLSQIQGYSQKLLLNLDPSLFQNITLGVLAIFIPFAIVFLTNLTDSKKSISEFERLVLNDEILGSNKVFWLSIFSIVFFAFFSGKDIINTAKIVAIIFALIIIFLFWKPFTKILKFSGGNKNEFEISFLKHLNFSKILRFKNKTKADKILRSWKSLWLSPHEEIFNERELTIIFTKHIDNAILYKKPALAIDIAKTYVQNIDKRLNFSIGYNVLPKILQWNNELKKASHNIYDHYRENTTQNLWPYKIFPTFIKWALIFKKDTPIFFNWHYFAQEMLPAVIKKLLQNHHDAYQLLTYFKNYIAEKQNEFNLIENENKKQEALTHMENLFSIFCNTFFENINNSESKYLIWEHFPREWKIAETNTKNIPTRIILNEFIKWSQQIIHDESNEPKLTEVINGLFQNVHSSLFTSFLMLYFYPEVKYVSQKQPTFFIISSGVSYSGEKNQEEITKMLQEKDNMEKIETVKIIFNFFQNWKPLMLYKNDLTSEENLNWKNYTETERVKIITKIRIHKLKNIQKELESEEVKKLCSKNKELEYRRKNHIELMKELLNYLQNSKNKI